MVQNTYANQPSETSTTAEAAVPQDNSEKFASRRSDPAWAVHVEFLSTSLTW